MSEIVHCPKCHSAVTVGADQAGRRVQCPSCLKEFFAPSSLGGAGSSAEDEDWLSLADPPAATAASKATESESPQAPSPESDDEDLLGENPFVDLPTGEGLGSESDPDDLFAGLPSLDALPSPDELPSFAAGPTSGPTSSSASGAVSGPAAAAKPTPQPEAAATIDPNEEFRVTCPICGSMLSAKAKQTGKTIKCGDCYSEVRVPKPPKKKTQPQRDDNAETFHFAETGASGRPADPFKKSADELLREAAREPDEKQSEPAFDAPSTIGWFKTVFGIFVDPGVISHFLGLAILLAIPAALTVAMPVFALGMFPLGLLGITLTVSCGFAILFGVANEHDRIEDWPTLDPPAWFESLWLVIAATAIAVGPPYVIATVFGAVPVIKLGLVMFSIYAAFPIILLSMLDEQSITSPFSADVGKSITRCQEEWGAFYFSTGLLFATLFGYFVMVSLSPASIAIGVTLSIGVVFMYFAILGRLALAIGEVVDLTALDNDDEDEEQ
ncbi:hypothetical protein Enr13x_64310 [Stieleria neptunia]|uniref:Uncharacterized protein n=1 Tax=Stieleria neptunia TaxID=2527979 RepID=A0A518I0A8_9BACT|nr:hypothetical protein [Stieleria neptunia]QDV46522.1 hypothetical protein Enr13x_64310 [Stieleria neptunia]